MRSKLSSLRTLHYRRLPALPNQCDITQLTFSLKQLSSTAEQGITDSKRESNIISNLRQQEGSFNRWARLSWHWLRRNNNGRLLKATHKIYRIIQPVWRKHSATTKLLEKASQTPVVTWNENTPFNPFPDNAEKEGRSNFENFWAVYLWRHTTLISFAKTCQK